MAKVVAPIVAKIEIIGKPKPSSYQEGAVYYPTLFLDESKEGEEAKIWKSLSEEEVSQLRKGARVQLVPAGADKHGNPKHNIVLLDAPAATAAPAAAPRPGAPAAPVEPRMSDELKRSIATYATDQIKAFKFIYNAVGAEFADDISAEDQRTIATTIYLQTQRRFGL